MMKNYRVSITFEKADDLPDAKFNFNVDTPGMDLTVRTMEIEVAELQAYDKNEAARVAVEAIGGRAIKVEELTSES